MRSGTGPGPPAPAAPPRTPSPPPSLDTSPTGLDSVEEDPFYPSSPVALCDYLNVPRHPGRRLSAPLSWRRFRSLRRSYLCPRWHAGQPPSLVERLALWPQHSAIREFLSLPCPLTAPALQRFTGYLTPFLVPDDLHAWAAALGYTGYARYLATPLCPPICPLRRHAFGCGRAVASISTVHDRPAPFLLVHWAWPFLTPQDRAALCGFPRSLSPMDTLPPGHESSPLTVFTAYARLRSQACSQSIGYLRQPRFPSTPLPATIPARRAHDNAIALLRYHFDYADFIRSMAFTYTYQGRDLDAIWDLIDSVAHLPQAPGWPAVDFDRAFRAMTLGVPLAGHFRCSYASVSRRNLYDNHPAAKTPDVLVAIRAKFIKEEDLSYNVIFPRWIWRFIFGLFLNPLTFVLPKYSRDLGRICVDSTNTLGPSDDGAPNRQIPKPGTPHRLDENPPISYGTALQRCLTWIYNVRIDHPSEDILMLPDDISAAFHQLFYHPSMMPVFASVFEHFLCIPASMIFGSSNSPSYYMLSGDLCSWLSSVRGYGQA